jgi:outer membrane protein assembly factor BamB
MDLAPTSLADVWPRFRGPNGDGQSDAAGIPAEWTDADYAWRVTLPGFGHSSPVVWNDRIFLTSANADTAELSILCFDLATGDQLWERRLAGGPHVMHRVNSFATSTPAVDADHIYVARKVGETVMLAALTHDGHDVWQRPTANLAEPHGFGTSPIVVGDVVCMTNDTEKAADSVIYGVDRRTGDELWRKPVGAGKTSYSTPCQWKSPEGKTLILMSTMGAGLTAYDPATGDIAWNALAGDLPDRSVSSPVLVGDLALVSCGAGNNGLRLIAARLASATSPPSEAYRLEQNIPNVPTPVVAGDLVFLWHDRGVVTCIDGPTGKVHWRERIGGNFHCSPLHIGDRVYCISLTGEVVVLAAKDDYELVARFELGEPVVATPAVADGHLLIRTDRSLLCVGGQP